MTKSVRKFLVIILTLVCAACLAFFCAACDDDGEQSSSTASTDSTPQTDGEQSDSNTEQDGGEQEDDEQTEEITDYATDVLNALSGGFTLTLKDVSITIPDEYILNGYSLYDIDYEIYTVFSANIEAYNVNYEYVTFNAGELYITIAEDDTVKAYASGEVVFTDDEDIYTESAELYCDGEKVYIVTEYTETYYYEEDDETEEYTYSTAVCTDIDNFFNLETDIGDILDINIDLEAIGAVVALSDYGELFNTITNGAMTALFTKTETADGYTLTLNADAAKAFIGDAYNLTIAELIDKYAGAGSYTLLESYLTRAGDGDNYIIANSGYTIFDLLFYSGDEETAYYVLCDMVEEMTFEIKVTSDGAVSVNIQLDDFSSVTDSESGAAVKISGTITLQSGATIPQTAGTDGFTNAYAQFAAALNTLCTDGKYLLGDGSYFTVNDGTVTYTSGDYSAELTSLTKFEIDCEDDEFYLTARSEGLSLTISIDSYTEEDSTYYDVYCYAYTHEYDDSGKVTYESYVNNYGDNNTRTYDYNDNGNTAYEIAESVDYTYSGKSVSATTYNEDGNCTSYSYANYDAAGALTSSYKYTYTYDKMGVLIEEKYEDSDGTSSTTTYDCEYTYDNNGNITERVYSNGNYTYTYTYAYDSDNNLIKETYERKYYDTVEYAYSYEYDSDGNVIKKCYNDEWGTETYEYYSNGVLSKYSYEYFSGGTVTYSIVTEYDTNGKRTKTTRIDTNSTNISEYDSDGNLTYDYYKDNYNEYSYTYTYDSYGNRTSTKYEDEDGYNYSITYTYDSRNNCTSETRTDSDGESYSYAYTYTKGVLTAVVYTESYADEDNAENNYSITRALYYTYGNDGKLSECKATYENNGILAEYVFTFDGNGNLTGVSYKDNFYNAYFTVTRTYDAYGNLLSNIYSDSDGNGYSYTYTYTDGLVTKIEYEKTDEEGNTFSEEYAYEYDEEENLTKTTYINSDGRGYTRIYGNYRFDTALYQSNVETFNGEVTQSYSATYNNYYILIEIESFDGTYYYHYTYDDYGDETLYECTDTAENVIECRYYNDYGICIEKIERNGDYIYHYTYDDDGDETLYECTDSAGNIIECRHYSDGLITEEKLINGTATYTYTYTYEDVILVEKIGIGTEENGETIYTYSYTYEKIYDDNGNFLYSVIAEYEGGNLIYATYEYEYGIYTYSYEYNNKGNVSSYSYKAEYSDGYVSESYTCIFDNYGNIIEEHLYRNMGFEYSYAYYYEYDEYGNVSHIYGTEEYDGEEITFTDNCEYDEYGNLLYESYVTDDDNYTYTYTYTYADDILTEYRWEYTHNDEIIEYDYITYNSNGDITEEKTFSIYEDYSYVTGYTYDQDGNCTRIDYTALEGEEEAYTYHITYEYNSDGYLTSEEYEASGFRYSYTYTYDQNGNCTLKTYTHSGGINGTYTYEYDDYGNCTSETYQDNDYNYTITYTYENGNLTYEKREENDYWYSYAYAYDADSTSVTFEDSSGEKYTYSYNIYGWETSYERVYDGNTYTLTYTYVILYAYEEYAPTLTIWTSSDGSVSFEFMTMEF